MDKRYAGVRTMAKGFVDGWSPVVVIMALTATLLYQQWQMKHPQRPLMLKVGDVLPTVSGTDLQGATRQIRFRSDSPTLLYVFSPQCVWCQRNMNSFSALVQQTHAIHVIAVSLNASGLGEFVSKSGLNRTETPVYVLSDQTRSQLKLAVTPETVLISRAGQVEKVWPGAYAGTIEQDVEATLRVKLPALPAASPVAADTAIAVVH